MEVLVTMISKLRTAISSDSVRARAWRGSTLVLGGFGLSMVLRLGSNLILTRILFPEAFGLMALVQVFLLGLQLLSDMGIYTAIMQNERGNEARFLNTAWVMEILRGILLWLIICAAAGPVATFYGQPQLADLLPVAGLVAIFMGFKSTKVAQANRGLYLGRLTLLDLGCQLASVIAMLILALLTESVWSLLLGTLLGEFIRTVASHLILPGVRNRFEWDRESFWNVFHFGKFIFAGSIAGFMINNADRAVLGKFVSLADLAAYNIGYFLAFVPLMLNQRLVDRVLTPLYSMAHRNEDGAQARIPRTRTGLAVGLMVLALVFGIIGDWLVRFLYTEPYYLGAPVMTLLSFSIMPVIALSHYRAALIGAGRAARSTLVLVCIALTQFTLLYIGVSTYGLLGAVAAPGVAALISYPIVVWLVRPVGVWSVGHDLGLLGGSVLSTALYLAWDFSPVTELLASATH